jgi:hypothetical protein
MADFSFHHFRFHLEPKVLLRMPEYNERNVIRGGFRSTFRRERTCRRQTFNYLIPTMDTVIRGDDFHTRKNRLLSRMRFGQDSFSKKLGQEEERIPRNQRETTRKRLSSTSRLS